MLTKKKHKIAIGYMKPLYQFTKETLDENTLYYTASDIHAIIHTELTLVF